MHFDLTDLRLFLHIVDAGSITAGAALSHLALPSASARLRALEASVGTALVTRERRGVTPTPAGVALAHHARGLLQQVNRMEEDLGEYALGFKGQVRLWCNTAVMSEFLPDPLADFLRAYPNVDVELQEQPSYRIVPAVSQGVADVGILSNAVDLSGLDVLPFRDDRLVLLVPPDHELAQRDAPVRFVETLRHDYVGLETASALSAHLDDQAARAGQRLRTRVRLRTFSAVLRMVARGVGVAVLPHSSAQRLRRTARVKRLELADPWANRQLVLCVRGLAQSPGYVQALVETLRQPV
ncbi:LysR substrate-binding domain-containing protein [Pseudomonadota bacterium AL_CKDN230030165-1A_HGKHYDSX7]